MNKFLNTLSDGKVMVDKVFKAAVACDEAKQKYGDIVIDGTLGTLFDENGILVAYDSIWSTYEKIDKIQKAKYASSIQGNPDFNQAVYDWLFSGLNIDIPCEVIASPGGAGAISSTMKNVLNPGETVIKPNLGWGPYKTMAIECALTLTDYNMFNGNNFDLENFKTVLSEVMEKQKRVLVIINDPCHNPSGYTMTIQEWDEVIQFVNELSSQGPVVILNDIAYVDYTNQGNTWKKSFEKFNNISENVMVVVAFSCSKTLTAYGARVGAQVVLTKDKAQLKAFKDAAIYSARSTWSTVNNSVMKLFSTIMNDDFLKNNYLKEKAYYINLLKERSAIFLKEAAEVNLEIYPYVEGFFITLKFPNQREKAAFNLKLQKNNIFLVEVDGGLRVAICTIPKRKIKGLAKRIKALM